MQVDDNAFTRKQALFVLEHAVRGRGVGGGQAWQAVLHLLALLEDFALHLIKVNPLCSVSRDQQSLYIALDHACFAAAMSQEGQKIHDVHGWETVARTVQRGHVSACTVWGFIGKQCLIGAGSMGAPHTAAAPSSSLVCTATRQWKVCSVQMCTCDTLENVGP